MQESLIGISGPNHAFSKPDKMPRAYINTRKKNGQ